MALPKSFYARDPTTVAKELLGCVLLKRHDPVLAGIIVETEAYYEMSGPGSRNHKAPSSVAMCGDPGQIFIYMVHGHWLLNIITLPMTHHSGVLIRALEPKKGLAYMHQQRNTLDVRNLTSGPGKLTQAFGIDKLYNGMKVYGPHACIYVRVGQQPRQYATSARIGVHEDIPRPLRFYIPGNSHVSRL
jgi:DNA-3-methyladenine glycosylase